MLPPRSSVLVEVKSIGIGRSPSKLPACTSSTLDGKSAGRHLV